MTTGVKGKTYLRLSTLDTVRNTYTENLTSASLKGGQNDRGASREAQILSIFRMLIHGEFTWFLLEEAGKQGSKGSNTTSAIRLPVVPS